MDAVKWNDPVDLHLQALNTRWDIISCTRAKKTFKPSSLPVCFIIILQVRQIQKAMSGFEVVGAVTGVVTTITGLKQLYDTRKKRKKEEAERKLKETLENSGA
jgi:hypothetical protein